MIELYDEHEAEAELATRLSSREWWVFVGTTLLQEIESEFYSGEASKDFELMLGPPVGEFKELFPGGVILPLAFAHKRHLNAQQLAELISDEGGPDLTQEFLAEHDIIYLQ